MTEKKTKAWSVNNDLSMSVYIYLFATKVTKIASLCFQKNRKFMQKLLTVTFGVGLLGLSGPKAPIVLGTNIRKLYCFASSITLCTPSMLTLGKLKWNDLFRKVKYHYLLKYFHVHALFLQFLGLRVSKWTPFSLHQIKNSESLQIICRSSRRVYYQHGTSSQFIIE